MYVIYNYDGSIKLKMLNEYVMQGNSYENCLFVGFDGRQASDYSLYAIFKLPNGDTTTVVSASEVATKEIDGVEYSGRNISLSNAETVVDGALQMNIKVLTTDTNKELVSFSAYITINPTGTQPNDPVIITADEYNNLIQQIGEQVKRYETIYKTNELGNLDNYEVGQAVLVYVYPATKVLYEIYQTSGGEKRSREIFNFSTTQIALSSINDKIPSDATSSNKLTSVNSVKELINESAAYLITKNANGDSFATKSELTSATTFYNGGEARTPTRNDYCYVLADETHDNATTKYSWQGGTYPTGQWTFEVVVNETPMTQAQLDALNSGITSPIVNVLKKGQSNHVKVDENTTLSQLYSVVGDSGILFITYLREGDTKDPLGWDKDIFSLSKDNTNRYFIVRWSSLFRDFYSTTDGDTKLLNIFERVPPETKLAETQTFEKINNKITSWQWQPDNNHYPSEKLVKDELDAIRNLITNIPQTYVASSEETNATMIIKFRHYARIYYWDDYQEEYKIVESERDINMFDVVNNILNTQDKSIDLWETLGSSDVIAVKAKNGDYYFVSRGTHGITLLNDNDNINVISNDVPDWWYAGETLYAYESPDITGKANTFTQQQTFSAGINTTTITQDGTHTITPNAIIDSVGTTIKDTTHTSYSGGVNCSKQYIFTQPLTSLSISAFEYLVNDTYKVWNISFKCGSGFAISFPSGKTIKWAEGQPQWDSETIYTLLVQEGIDTDYIIYVIRA